MSFLGLYISIQHELCNINGILVRFTNKFLFTSCYLRILFTIVNGDWKICYACRVIWINWFRWRKMYSWKTRPWIKRRSTGGYFNSIIGAMMIEDRMGFKKMFQMNVYVKHSCIVAHRCQPEKNEKTIFFYLKNKTKKTMCKKIKIKLCAHYCQEWQPRSSFEQRIFWPLTDTRGSWVRICSLIDIKYLPDVTKKWRFLLVVVLWPLP